MSKSAWNRLIEIIEKSLIHLPEELSYGTWVVAVSGGADSTALLFALHEIHPELVVAHVNYGKRGKESDLDELEVRKMAERLQIPFETVRAPAFKKGNFQENARRFRYDFFEKMCEKYQSTLVALAHHAEDQRETVLFRSRRKASPTARLGMVLWREPYFRPFLSLQKSELKAALREKKISWREDASNHESVYARNYLRNILIPELDKENPNWADDMMSEASHELFALDVMANLSASKISFTEKEIRIKDDFWRNDLELEPFKLLMHLAFKNDIYDLSYPAVRKMDNLLPLQKGRKMNLGNHWIAIRERGFISIRKEEQDDSHPSILIKNEIEWRFLDELGYDYQILNELPDFKAHPESLFLDADKIVYPITIRNWQAGDRFKPLGMKGTKLVSDFLSDLKITKSEKEKVLVIFHFDTQIQAIIFKPQMSRFNRPANFVKCELFTKRILQISSKK